MEQRFSKLTLTDWQQFSEVDIDFHERLTILTGANGSGKTTILNLLGKHYNWRTQALAVPKKSKKTGLFSWAIGILLPERVSSGVEIGKLIYTDGGSASLVRPESVDSAPYEVTINGMRGVNGFFIPSHRTVYRYQKLENIPTDYKKLSKLSAFESLSNITRERYFGGALQYGASYRIKETLVAWSAFGNGNESMDNAPQLTEFYRGFEEILRKILPPSLGFNALKIKDFEVVLDCDSGEFLIDAASGGITALIDMAWQIYMYHEDKDKHFTVIIDEIENHLHPLMQRSLLSNLLTAFPNVSFIASTHSPLIVNSVRDSKVYALRYVNNRVVSEELDLVNQAKSATEILNEVLGVPFTMPVWVEEELKAVVEEFSKKDMTKEEFSSLRTKLEGMGLGDLVPQAISDVVTNKDDQVK